MEFVLELQAMEAPSALEGHGGGGRSDASLLLCGNSSLSLTECE
jgi:hypothetical protein